MKKIMFCAFLAFATYTTKATDLVVQESGPTGTYSSISAAITAATNGDRIIINNRTGGLYWSEDININKSIQLLSNVDTVRFKYQGNVTITPAVGREITIIGMENNLGSITAASASPAGTRTKVNIYNCLLNTGNIVFDYDYFNVNLVSNILNIGNITIRFGKIIGNHMGNTGSSYGIIVNTDATPTNDTILIIGNKIYSPASYGLLLNSSSQFVLVSNNLFRVYIYGIYIPNIKGGQGVNSINNNSFYCIHTSYAYTPIRFNTSATTDCKLDILNNVAVAYTGSDYFISLSGGVFSGALNVSYNYTGSNLNGCNSTSLPNNGTNSYVNSYVGYSNGTTLQNSTGSPAINGAHPAKYYYDLDLTRGDAGCYGGSWTLNNFFPITGSSRVYMINSARSAIVGSIINIKADGFDR